MKKGIFTLLMVMLELPVLLAQDIEIPQTQNTLITKHTATWCPPCGQTAWEVFEDLLKNAGDGAVFLQAHRSTISNYYSKTAVDLLSNMDRSLSQPEFFTNTNYVGSGNSSSIKTNILNLVAAAREQLPPAQTGVIFGYDAAAKKLTVRTQTRFFQSTEGEYSLSVFLVNKVLVGFQQSRSDSEEHHEVLRGELSDNSFGAVIATGAIEAGAEFDYELSKVFPEDLDVDNVQITVVLWKKGEQKYSLVNTNVVRTATNLITTSSRELTRLQAGIQVLPTLIAESAQVLLEVEQPCNQADLALYDLTGRRLQTIYRGKLSSGKQSFWINRPAATASGLYFIRLQAEGGVVSRKVIFR